MISKPQEGDTVGCYPTIPDKKATPQDKKDPLYGYAFVGEIMEIIGDTAVVRAERIHHVPLVDLHVTSRPVTSKPIQNFDDLIDTQMQVVLKGNSEAGLWSTSYIIKGPALTITDEERNILRDALFSAFGVLADGRAVQVLFKGESTDG